MRMEGKCRVYRDRLIDLEIDRCVGRIARVVVWEKGLEFDTDVILHGEYGETVNDRRKISMKKYFFLFFSLRVGC